MHLSVCTQASGGDHMGCSFIYTPPLVHRTGLFNDHPLVVGQLFCTSGIFAAENFDFTPGRTPLFPTFFYSRSEKKIENTPGCTPLFLHICALSSQKPRLVHRPPPGHTPRGGNFLENTSCPQTTSRSYARKMAGPPVVREHWWSLDKGGGM